MIPAWGTPRSSYRVGRAFPTVLGSVIGRGPDALLALGLNIATVHTDLVVGGPQVDVDGLDRDGRATPIIRDDGWILT